MAPKTQKKRAASKNVVAGENLPYMGSKFSNISKDFRKVKILFGKSVLGLPQGISLIYGSIFKI